MSVSIFTLDDEYKYQRFGTTCCLHVQVKSVGVEANVQGRTTGSEIRFEGISREPSHLAQNMEHCSNRSDIICVIRRI